MPAFPRARLETHSWISDFGKSMESKEESPSFWETSMWMPETRARYKPDHLRYGGDLCDEEWQVIAPFMPPPAKTGRRRV